jgi:glycosyltransferase involved in cell wall biosynthesis
MQTQPLVTVAIPVYNGSNYLRNGLDSILSQTYDNLEVIIVDNASTDNTEAISREYVAADSRVQYYRNEQNIGSISNFNRGVTLANGKYFRWAAHDDLCSEDSIEKCVAALEADPQIVLAYPEDRFIDEHGDFVDMESVQKLNATQASPSARFHHYITIDWLQRWNTRQVHPVFGLFRTDVLKRTPLFGRFMGTDRALIGEMTLYGKVVEVPGTYFMRRMHATMSERAYRSDYELSLSMTPERRGQLFLPRVLMLRGLWDVVNRVPLSTAERGKCYLELVRWFAQYGGIRMVKDTIEAVRYLREHRQTS